MLELFDVQEVLHDTPLTRVVRAKRRADQLAVVLKTVPHDERSSTRLARLRYEHSVLGGLGAVPPPHVVQALDLLDSGDALTLVLQDSGGYSLRHHLDNSPLDLREVLHVATAVAQALVGVHDARVIHKDISANNIIFNRATGGVELIDFGISCLLPREAQNVDSLWGLEGTPAYISPEQTGRTNRPLDWRTDFYSLGATLYELLTHTLPFPQQDLGELVYAILTTHPAPPRLRNPEVPEMLNQLVLRLMEKAPERRYRSARGLHADLQRCATAQAAGDATPFALGQDDREATKELPQRLFGREHEVSRLLQLYQRAAEGQVVVAMVAGPSGIGKSSLVQELQGSIVRHRSLFIAGKHDQLQRHIPFSAFGQAINMLVRRVLKEPEAELVAWRRRVQGALGNVGGMLLEIAPALQLLVGAQPPPPDLGPQETENCLLMVLQRFIQALCAKQPLVIFLDDLQWADSGTLKLVKLLHSTAQGYAGLLFVGGYRSNEVPADHPLARALAVLAEQPLSPTQATEVIQVPPLSAHAMAALLGEASGKAPEACQDIARLLHAKTDGNPYFLHELVHHLWRVQVIRLEGSHGGWHWDMERLDSTSLPDSVAVLVTEKLRGLEPAATAALGLAACLGNEFACADVAALTGQSITALKLQLLPALNRGLLVPASTGYRYAAAADDVVYRFAHDRVQQTAYELVPPQVAMASHLHAGRHLQQRLQPGEPVFSVLNHLNRAQTLIDEPQERLGLVALNLTGGREAKRATAYSISMEYLNTAMGLLPSTAWATHTALIRDLYVERAQCLFLLGDHTAALSDLDVTLEHMQTAPEKARMLALRSRILGTHGRYAEGVAACEAGLRLLGHPIALSSPVTTLRALLTLKMLMRNRSIASLKDAPQITDAHALAALELLRAALTFTYMLSKVVLANVCFHTALLSIRYGNSMHSANAYGALSLVLSNLNDYAQAREYAGVAMAQLETSASPAEATFMTQGWVQFLDMDLSTLYQSALDGHALAREKGDPAVACYFTLLATVWLLFSALSRVEETSAQYEAFLLLRNNPDCLRFLRVMRQAARCLVGRTLGPDSFVDSSFDAEQMAALMERDETLPAFMTMVFYLHRAWPQARLGVQLATKKQTLMEAPGMEGMAYAFYGALTLIQEARGRSRGRRRPARPFSSLRKKLRLGSTAGTRYRGHNCLLDAELAALRGDAREAMRLYDEALNLLGTSGRVDAHAVGYECTGRFYLQQGASDVAMGYLHRAHALFASWGARAKVGLLEREFPALLTQTRDASRPALSASSSVTQTSAGTHKTTSEGDRHIDMPALMRVTHAITSEVHIQRLAKRILEGVELVSDATRSALFLWHSDTPTLAADTHPGTPLPMQVVRYAQRMREAVTVQDVQDTRANQDFGDGALSQLEARSLVCVPIVHQAQCRGVIYLENNAMTHAFASQRLVMVEMLAGQAAIALENARTYSHLEEVVATRTEELRQAHDRLVRMEREETETQMAGGFAHEMRNALAGTSYALTALDAMEGDEEVHQLLQVVRRGVERGLGLTEQILDYAQVTHLVVKEDVVSLGSVVDSVLQEMRAELSALQIDCRVEVPPDLMVRAQEPHAHAMVRNLLSNARDALAAAPETRRRTLRIAGKRAADDGILLVEDDALGMPVAVQAKVFLPFFTTKGARGRGLGLGLARKLAQAYSGDLHFTSQEEMGTTFRLRLPLG